MRIVETRSGDTSQRAGIVITAGGLLLCGQPTNMVRNNWKLDIFKGHIQFGENPIDAAIRECWEESNIRFERWKLTNPIQVSCDGSPLFLFLAKIDEIINPALLSRASTFIDNDGIRKPEVEAYIWLNPKTHLHLIQERLRSGIQYYFSKVITEDCQTTGAILGDLPQNAISVLSPGYKNGCRFPVPKKRAISRDYDSISGF